MVVLSGRQEKNQEEESLVLQISISKKKANFEFQKNLSKKKCKSQKKTEKIFQTWEEIVRSLEAEAG